MSSDLNIRVSLVEDDVTIREGYAYLIGQAEGCTVVSHYGSVEEALKRIEKDDPDVLLLDVELPGQSGIDALPRFKKLLPETHILILTVYEQDNLIFRALGNGASGYLTKDTPPERIVAAIREVMEGGGPMSAHIARMVISSFQRSSESPLTRRETEILEHIATGKSRKRIADELFIDLETVKSHIKNIYHKLDVHSKADAIKTARDNKFI
jgi:DNA-binding NarL/FixJ family response regulator